MARRRTMAGESMHGLNEVWALIPESYQFNVRFWHRAAVAALTTLDFNRFRDL